jgi:hypothetical protein
VRSQNSLPVGFAIFDYKRATFETPTGQIGVNASVIIIVLLPICCAFLYNAVNCIVGITITAVMFRISLAGN